MTSMTFCASASVAVRLTASRTARSAHSALRPRAVAKPRMKAAASCTRLAVRVSVGAAPALSSPRFVSA